jgi:hypothetical protein
MKDICSFSFLCHYFTFAATQQNEDKTPSKKKRSYSRASSIWTVLEFFCVGDLVLTVSFFKKRGLQETNGRQRH